MKWGSIRNLKFLAPFSLVANVFEFYTLGVIFYYIFKDPLPSFESRPLFSSWEKLPIFFLEPMPFAFSFCMAIQYVVALLQDTFMHPL